MFLASPPDKRLLRQSNWAEEFVAAKKLLKSWKKHFFVKNKKLRTVLKYLGLIAPIVLLLVVYQNCGTSSNPTNAGAVGVTGTLILTPSSAPVALGGGYQFTATGGSGNYSYSSSPLTLGSVN